MQQAELMLQVVAKAALECGSNVPKLMTLARLDAAAAHLLQQCAKLSIQSEAEMPASKM